jgi:murein DD-endopeptidase MepM/ murein hydrolase activator NlpD
MQQPNDMYTIIIFRGSMATPLRLNFPKSLVKKAIILGVFLVLVEMMLLSQFVIRIGEMWELRALRAEIVSAREQTTTFSNAVEELKKKFLAMKEINQRLRVMLGMEPQPTEDLLNGRGGDEVPLKDGPEKDALEVSKGFSPEDPTDVSGGAEAPPNSVASHVQHELTWLQQEAVSQERALEQLSEAANARSARWASTPSVWPVKGWVTSGFGPRISPFTGQPAMHEGVDIGAAPNSAVLAPAAGRVTVTGSDGKMGNVIGIDHGYGIETQYGHLSKVLVKSGQKVKRGDLIGLVGSSGFSTGPHLHYLIKINNQPVNPQRYILN